MQEHILLQQNGRLDNWHFDIPFEYFIVRVDDVIQCLAKLFLDGANIASEIVIVDIENRAAEPIQHDRLKPFITPLSCLKTFLSDCLLEKLRYVANMVLHERNQN